MLSKLVFAYENHSDFEKLNELEQKIERTKNHINSMRMLQLKRQKELKAILMEYKSKNKKTSC